MKPGLGPVQYRSTLAHELGHAHYGHTGHLRKNEHRADMWAARKLLTFEMLTDAARITLDTGGLAAEMDVLPWVVHAFVSTLDFDQTQELLEQARRHQI